MRKDQVQISSIAHTHIMYIYKIIAREATSSKIVSRDFWGNLTFVFEYLLYVSNISANIIGYFFALFV